MKDETVTSRNGEAGASRARARRQAWKALALTVLAASLAWGAGYWISYWMQADAPEIDLDDLMATLTAEPEAGFDVAGMYSSHMLNEALTDQYAQSLVDSEFRRADYTFSETGSPVVVTLNDGSEIATKMPYEIVLAVKDDTDSLRCHVYADHWAKRASLELKGNGRLIYASAANWKDPSQPSAAEAKAYRDQALCMIVFLSNIADPRDTDSHAQ